MIKFFVSIFLYSFVHFGMLPIKCPNRNINYFRDEEVIQAERRCRKHEIYMHSANVNDMGKEGWKTREKSDLYYKMKTMDIFVFLVCLCFSLF